MKTPKVPEVNLPYASTVASYFGDQGGAQGNSFLGRMYKAGSRPTMSQSQRPAPVAGSAGTGASPFLVNAATGIKGN